MAVTTNGIAPAAEKAVPAEIAEKLERRSSRVTAPITSLIGREREIDQIRALIKLNGSRLITITGPGGVGKSRLAIELLRGVVERDGWNGGFVELRDVAHRAGLLPAIISTFDWTGGGDGGSPDLFQTAAIVPAHPFLLVLDNLEQLGPVASEIARLLGASPNLVVLATSRELVGCAGERRVELKPLPTPDEQRFLSPEEIADCPSVRLFLDRARNASPDLPTTSATMATIAEICRRVEGIPLAIELAAAWAVALSPAAILQDLESLLLGASERTGDRSLSMSATIAWSYERLDRDEQRCFRLLSVFAGSLDWHSVANVAERAGLTSDSAAISAWIRALVEKSLLVRTFDEQGSVKLGMYEMIRRFARSRLQLCGEESSVREAHAQWTIECAERAETTPADRFPTTANIRLALGWLSESGDGERYVHLCLLAVDHWYLTGNQHEGHTHLRQATVWAVADAGARARLYEELGRFARALGDIAGAADALGVAGAEYRRFGDSEGEARCLRALGSIRVLEQRYDDAVRLCEAALAIHRAAADRVGMAQCLHSIAWVAIERDQLEEAERLLRTSLDLVGTIDDPRTLGRFRLSLGALSVRQKRYPDAAEHFLICAELWRRCDYQSGLAEVMADLGAIAVVAGDCAAAASYLLTSVTTTRTLGVLLRSPELIEAAAGLALACGNLDQARRWLGAAADFRAVIGGQVWSTWAGHLSLWRTSARLSELPLAERPPSMAEAIDEIWRWLTTLPLVGTHGGPKPRLTRRELEVLGLITTGLSDQAIADQIFISRRTVSRHVSSILAKLKLESRTAAAVLAVREGLIPT